MKHVLLAILCLLTVSDLFAQQQEQVQPVEYEAQIRELLEITGSGDMGIQVMQQMTGSLKQALPQVPDDFWDEFMAEVEPEHLIELIVPIYARHFTEEEIEGLLAFYKTDVGQSVIRKLPVVMQESMVAGNEWGQIIAQRAIEKLREKGYEIDI